MKPIVFHPAAEAELPDTIDFYESRSAGLGRRFLDEVEQGIAASAELPST